MEKCRDKEKQYCYKVKKVEPENLEIEAFCDNEDTIIALNMSKSFCKGKRIDMEVAKIKEMLEKERLRASSGYQASISWLMT